MRHPLLSKQAALSIFSALLITACGGSGADMLKKDYDPTTDARIRVYGQNGNPTILNVGIDCATNPKGIKINVGGGFGEALGSMVGSTSNESIGIPQTEVSTKLSAKDGILSKAFYRELIIPANKPVNVRPGLQKVGTEVHIGNIPVFDNTCKTTTISFTPKPGKDYEAVGLRQGGGCNFFVSEITTEAGQLSEIRTLETQAPYKCD
ncbi:hypothetical protein KRX19_00600 [Cardiobacteriaceae bacterium TAE3-ERU3]|nr:hypothetical protein [Cardiobacteriaceae bacterium TAE3-ERU3]